jgi:formylglycine-generating enzyme required for sulfatase activity
MSSANSGSGPRQLRVFLCHARADTAAVRVLYDRLREEGFLPWLDEEDLIAGQDWQVEIPKAVRAADLVLVCLSTHSTNKEGYVQKEIKLALDVADEKPEGTIYIVPLKLEECSVPDRLGRWQWVDFFHPKGYERLLKALRHRAESLGLGAQSGPSQVIQPGTVRTDAKDGLEYVWIPPGEFTMGATPGDGDVKGFEKPAHRVRISRGYWLGKTPVTVGAYRRFARATGHAMPETPRCNPGWEAEDHPIVKVSWNDAQAYCKWAGGRLPTEAEWEYAARGGREGSVYPWGNEISADRANYDSKGTTPVLRYPAQNEWGLHDISGNVLEWVADWFDENWYSTLSREAVVADPKGPKQGYGRVMRGGSWGTNSWCLRATRRNWLEPELENVDVGFRCAREVLSP